MYTHVTFHKCKYDFSTEMNGPSKYQPFHLYSRFFKTRTNLAVTFASMPNRNMFRIHKDQLVYRELSNTRKRTKLSINSKLN